MIGQLSSSHDILSLKFLYELCLHKQSPPDQMSQVLADAAQSPNDDVSATARLIQNSLSTDDEDNECIYVSENRTKRAQTIQDN